VRPGGSPLNTAVGLARLGTPTWFRGRLASGPVGRLLHDHLTGSGVDLSGSVDAAEPATLAIATLDPAGKAAYQFYVSGTADWAWTAAELSGWPVDRVAAVHTGSLALALPPGGPLIEDLLSGLRDRVTVSIDPNLRTGLVPAAAYHDRHRRWTALADIFRLSDEDLAELAPGVPVEEVCAQWHADGVVLAVVTRGAAGALASLRGELIEVPAAPAAVVDTVGAGDAFTAGLLHSLWREGHLGGRLDGLTTDGLARALAFASRVAALTCEVPGADPPTARQVAR